MEQFGVLELSVLTSIFSILTLLVALGVIVFVHEYGHFKVARLLGFTIETFSVGFGQRIAGFRDRYGTEWKIGWLPLGGYVKFQGDANAASLPDGDTTRVVQPGDFQTKPVWRRALVVAAGPMANFILGILLLAASALIFGAPIPGPKVGQVVAGMPAEQAGLKTGDLIKTIAGKTIHDFNDITAVVRSRPGETVDVVYERGGARGTVTLTIRTQSEDRGLMGTVTFGRIGVGPSDDPANLEQVGPLRALEYGFDETWRMIAMTGRFIGRLFTGHESVQQLGGLLSMGSATSQAASHGFVNYLSVIAFLSVSIGLINLFPIPILDGGHLVFYALEAVRRKPLGAAAQEWALKIGLVLVLALMFVGNFNDAVRFVGRMVGSQ